LVSDRRTMNAVQLDNLQIKQGRQDARSSQRRWKAIQSTLFSFSWPVRRSLFARQGANQSPRSSPHRTGCSRRCIFTHPIAVQSASAATYMLLTAVQQQTSKLNPDFLLCMSALANHCCKQARMTRKCMNNITSAYIPDESKPSSRFPLLLRTWQKAEFWLKDQAKSE
jgi:hypothetical protein